MSKIVKLTESDLNRLVKRIVKEQSTEPTPQQQGTLRKVDACSKDGLIKIKNMIKRAPTFTIEVDKNYPEWVIIRDPSGDGCACKRQDIFILQ